MDFGQTHRVIKRVDIEPLLAALRATDKALWDAEEAMRQKLAGPRPTRSIFLYNSNAMAMPRDRRVRQEDITRHAGWETFHPIVQPVIDNILADYPRGGVVFRCQIANLIPGGLIERHMDVSPLLRMSHRIHLPLITWPEVRFSIDDKPFHFEAGVAFELNNQRYHEVENRSPHDRFHLIFDYLPEDYDEAPIRYVQKHGVAPPVWPMPAADRV